MPYTKVNWQDGATPENEDTLGQMDQGIADAHAGLPPSPVGQDGKWLKVAGGAMLWDAIDIAEVTGLQTALDAKQATSEKAQANGYASLGADTKVPAAQLRLALSDFDLAPTCILTHSGNYTLPNGLNTLNLDTEVVDTHAMHTGGQAFIVLTAGYWLVWIIGRMPAGGGGTARELILEIAGARVIDIVYPTFSAGAHDWTASLVYRCPTNQNMALQAYQDTGGNVTGSRMGMGCRYLGKL